MITRFVYTHESDPSNGWVGDWLVTPYIDDVPTNPKIIECQDAAEAVFSVLGTLTRKERARVTKVNVKRKPESLD